MAQYNTFLEGDALKLFQPKIQETGPTGVVNLKEKWLPNQPTHQVNVIDYQHGQRASVANHIPPPVDSCLMGYPPQLKANLPHLYSAYRCNTPPIGSYSSNFPTSILPHPLSPYLPANSWSPHFDTLSVQSALPFPVPPPLHPPGHSDIYNSSLFFPPEEPPLPPKEEPPLPPEEEPPLPPEENVPLPPLPKEPPPPSPIKQLVTAKKLETDFSRQSKGDLKRAISGNSKICERANALSNNSICNVEDEITKYVKHPKLLGKVDPCCKSMQNLSDIKSSPTRIDLDSRIKLMFGKQEDSEDESSLPIKVKTSSSDEEYVDDITRPLSPPPTPFLSRSVYHRWHLETLLFRRIPIPAGGILKSIKVPKAKFGINERKPNGEVITPIKSLLVNNSMPPPMAPIQHRAVKVKQEQSGTIAVKMPMDAVPLLDVKICAMNKTVGLVCDRVASDIRAVIREELLHKLMEEPLDHFLGENNRPR